MLGGGVMSGIEGAVHANDAYAWMRRQGWDDDLIDAAIHALVRVHMLAAPSVLRRRWDAVTQAVTERFRKVPHDVEAA